MLAGINLRVTQTVTSSGGSSSSSSVTYIPTTQVPASSGFVNGSKSTPTWHNIPSMPSYLPSSQYASWVEEWKRKHPENFYAHGGFPEMGSMFIPGEATL